jgi:hypothetical protein
MLLESSRVKVLVSRDRYVIQSEEIGVVICSEDDPYLRSIIQSIRLGAKLPLKPAGTVNDVRYFLRNLESISLSENTVCTRHFLKLCNTSPILKERRGDWCGFIKECKIIPKGYVLGFKSVRSNYESLHDRRFVYKIGEVARPLNPSSSKSVCGSGIHVGTYQFAKNFAERQCAAYRILAIAFSPKDVLDFNFEKVRCSKAIPIKEVNSKEEAMKLKVSSKLLSRLEK